jgi:hypothetical protein
MHFDQLSLWLTVNYIDTHATSPVVQPPVIATKQPTFHPQFRTYSDPNPNLNQQIGKKSVCCWWPIEHENEGNEEGGERLILGQNAEA